MELHIGPDRNANLNSASPPSETWLFAQQLLGNPVRGAEAEQASCEFLEAIAPERAREYRRLKTAAAGTVSPPSEAWLFAQQILGEPIPDPSAQIAKAQAREEFREWLADISTVHEALWDPSKHPRGAYSQNPGWFSPTSGAGTAAGDGAAQSQRVGAEPTQTEPESADRATPRRFAVGNNAPTKRSADDDWTRAQRSPVGVIPRETRTGANDRVELDLKPASEGSMDWYTWRAPADGRQVAETQTDHGGSWQKQRAVIDGKEVYRVRYTLTGSAQIRIDADKIRRLASQPDSMTLQQAYGHEQRHVKNFITNMHWGKEQLESLEDQVYDSEKAADQAAEANIKRVRDAVDDRVRVDKRHESPSGPKVGEKFPPVGLTPRNSKGVAR